MQPVASVIVPVHDAAVVLGEQLEALATQVAAPPFEVIVVLNRCTDGSGSVARSFADRLPLEVVHADARPSAAYARNVGASRARGDMLLFCDADDRVNKGWVAGMVAGRESNDADFVGGSFVVDRVGLPGWAYEHFYEWLDGPALKEYRGLLVLPISSNLGVTRSAFDAVRGFDQTFPGAGGEDNDLVDRLLLAGYRVGAAHDALITYQPRRTARSIARQQRGYAPGKAYLLSLQHRLPRPGPRREEWKSTVRWLTAITLRQRTWRPGELFARTAERCYRQRSRRRAWSMARSLADGSAPDSDIDHADAVVPPDVPVVGGLAFRIEAAAARHWASRSVEPASLRVAQALLQAGEVVIDYGAGIGVFSVCAAKCVGGDGYVYSYEAESSSCSRLQVNLERHHVDSVVQVITRSGEQGPRHRQADPAGSDASSDRGRMTSHQLNPIPVPDGTVRLVRLDLSRVGSRAVDSVGLLLRRNTDAAVLVEMGAMGDIAGTERLRALLELIAPNRRWLRVVSTRGPESVGIATIEPGDLDCAELGLHGSILAVPSHRTEELREAGLV